MMKKIMGWALVAMVCFVSCTELDREKGAKAAISGFAQKGQFIKGSEITAYELDGQLVATGTSFPSYISDDLGAFSLNSAVSAPYLELRAEGYYFDENLGEISAAPIYLNALTSSSRKEVNINLLTTFISGRIRNLIAQGKSFDQAKASAEAELLKAFTGTGENYGISGMESLNIAEDGDGNAILLAVSCLMQQGRSAGEIQSLIARIASEFEKNGTLSEALLAEIRLHEADINVLDVMEHLTRFYEEKGLADYRIPPFYKFIRPDMEEEFRIVGPMDMIPSGSFHYGHEGGSSIFQVISLHPFTVESDASWLTFEKKDQVRYYYEIKESVAPNEKMSPRTGKLTFKSESGEVLCTKEIRQGGHGQRIYIEIPTTKVSPGYDGLREGDKVNVNGEIYQVTYEPGRYIPCAYVKPSASGYAVSASPELVVPAANGDLSSATITYPPVVNEYLTPKNGNDIELSSLPKAEDLMTPYFGYYKCQPGSVGSEDVTVTLSIVCAQAVIRYWNLPVLSKIVMECNEGTCLSGGITFSSGGSTSRRSPVYSNGSRRITVINNDLDDEIRFLVHPENLKTLKLVEAYDQDGKLLPVSYQFSVPSARFGVYIPLAIR